MSAASGHAASVEFIGISKTYGSDSLAVDNISLRIEAGQLVTLLGPSGCGKTTTLRMIAGLEEVTSGKILINDVDVTGVSASDRNVSMVFQSYALFPHMDICDNVAFGLRMSGMDRPAARRQASEELQKVGLTGLDERLPSELSGGQQQRVAVARALVLEPKVLLFDEPLSNLDARLRRKVREDIRDLQKSLALTVVYVTHDQEEALAVSDCTVVMNQGAIAQMGTPRELYELPASSFVADFIGEANLLECQIRSVAGGQAQVALGELTMHVPARELRDRKPLLAVRPNQVRLTDTSGGSEGVAGKLLKVTYVGHQFEYVVATDHGNIFAVSGDTSSNLAVGQDVCVSFVAKGPVLIPAD